MKVLRISFHQLLRARERYQQKLPYPGTPCRQSSSTPSCVFWHITTKKEKSGGNYIPGRHRPRPPSSPTGNHTCFFLHSLPLSLLCCRFCMSSGKEVKLQGGHWAARASPLFMSNSLYKCLPSPHEVELLEWHIMGPHFHWIEDPKPGGAPARARPPRSGGCGACRISRNGGQFLRLSCRNNCFFFLLNCTFSSVTSSHVPTATDE